MTTNGENGTSTFYEEEENLKKLCNFLRSAEGPAVREAIEMEKRVYYLKGTGFVTLNVAMIRMELMRLTFDFCFSD